MLDKKENLGKHGRHAEQSVTSKPVYVANNKYSRYNNGATVENDRVGAYSSAQQMSSRNMQFSGGSNAQFQNNTPRAFVTKPKKKHKALKIVLVVVLVLLVLLGVWGFSLYNSAKTLKSEAPSVMQDVSNIQSSITGGQYSEAVTYANNIATASANMKQELDSPAWAVASVIPFVGSDISSVKTLVGVLNEAATDVLIPLTTSIKDAPLEGLINDSGAIDVDTVSTLLSAVESTAPAMDSCASKIEKIPSMNISQLEDVLGPAKEKIVNLNTVYQEAAAFAPVVGSVLGDGGERTYLITAQNSAELRASGGFPGTIATLKITDGKISMGDFGTPYDSFVDETPESVAANAEEASIFSPAYLNISRDFGFDPDFERVATVWATAYMEKNETAVNGVISITPAMIQNILKVTGGITLADGTQLDGNNAAKVLQHDLYWKYLSAANRTDESDKIVDALFADAANQSFDKLLSNMKAKTLTKFAQSMLSGMQNREVMLYLTDASEQAQIESLGISGALNSDAANPKIGTFVNIWIPSKTGWYLDVDTQIENGIKNADGTITYKVTTTFRNNITAEEAATGGSYIMGEREYDPGDMQPFLYLYAPAGGSISYLQATNTSSGEAVALSEATHEGLQLFYTAPVEHRSETPLLPGQSIVCTYSVTVSAEAESELGVMKMPTLTEYR